MKALKLNDSQLERIFFGDSERFEVIEEGEWEQEGKYQNCEFLFKDKSTQLLYKGFVSRSGSPFTEWTYDSDIINDVHKFNPVEEIQVTVTQYKEVSKDKITELEVIETI